MNALTQTFTFNQSDCVRIILDENNTPMFVAKDVATALGYSNTKDAISRHCRGVVKHYPIQDSLNRTQNVRVIYEPDVYALIFGSKLPSAVKFQDWVFNEVLPTIRKTGSYTTPTAPAKPNNTLNAHDMMNLKHLIHLCGIEMTASNSVKFAIHTRLRELTGTTGGEAYTTEHLPIIANELVRVYDVLDRYGQIRRRVEAEIIRHVLRGGGEKCLSALLNDMDKARQLRPETFLPHVAKLIRKPLNDLIERR